MATTLFSFSHSGPHSSTNEMTAIATTRHCEADGLQLGVLSELLAYQLRRAQSRVYNSISPLLEACELTPGQAALLIKISNNRGISQTALAKANGIERSTLGEIIERFEKRGLIVRRRHPNDGRAYAVDLSPKGEEVVEELVPTIVARESELLADWSPAEKQTLLDLLSKLADAET